MNLRGFGLASLLLALGCGSKADPLADDGAPMDATDDDGKPSDENSETVDAETSTGEDPPGLEPVWEHLFPVTDGGRVRDLDVAASGMIVALVQHEGEEGSLSSELSALSESGEGLWSLNLSFIGEKLCVSASGRSYVVGFPYQPSMPVAALQIASVTADGTLAWSVAPEFDFPFAGQPGAPGIECKDLDDSVLVSEERDGGAILFHFDSAGFEINRVEDPLELQAYRPTSLALKADGELLVGGWVAVNPIEPFVATLDAAGQQSSLEALGGMAQLGPWVATNGTHHAFATLTSESGSERLRVARLDDEGVPLWEDTELEGSSNAMARAVVVHPDGSIYGSAPREDGVIRVRKYDLEGAGGTSTLTDDDDGPSSPSTLGIARTGELLVGGELGQVPWIAAYDL